VGDAIAVCGCGDAIAKRDLGIAFGVWGAIAKRSAGIAF